MQNGLSKGGVKLGAFMAASLISACGANNQSSSDTQHAVDHPTRGTGTFQWVAVTPEQMNEVMGPLLGAPASAYLPADHALVKRTQYWLDQIDTAIRREHPDQVANTPKPQARVMMSEVPNAYVSPMLVCHDVPVQLKTGSGLTVDRVLLDVSTGTLENFPATDPETGAKLGCVHGENSESTLKELAAEFNRNTKGCQLEVAGSGGSAKLVPSAACERSDSLQGVKDARKVVIMQTANFVTMHTGIFSMMSEENIVSVITHELGHYYRSHSTAQASQFDYFYTLTNRNGSDRPQPEPELQDLGKRAYFASLLLSNSDALQAVAGAKLRSDLYFGAGLLVSTLGDMDNAAQVCKNAAESINSEGFAKAIGQFPLGKQLTDGQKAAYRDFEKDALACLATVKFKVSGQSFEADEMSWTVLRAAVQGTQWPMWVFANPSTVGKVSHINKLSAARLGNDAPEAATVAEAFIKASAALNQQDHTYQADLKEAFDKHVGQYTAEQEADDQGAEWLSDIGIDPKAAVDSMRRLGAGTSNGLGGLLVGSQDCDKLADAGWIGADGGYNFVPIGNYSEDHHSICYRMFNLSREIDAHHYQASTSNHPGLLSAHDWKTLQDSADAVSKSVDAVLADSLRVAELLKKSGFGQCVYSYAYSQD